MIDEYTLILIDWGKLLGIHTGTTFLPFLNFYNKEYSDLYYASKLFQGGLCPCKRVKIFPTATPDVIMIFLSTCYQLPFYIIKVNVTCVSVDLNTITDLAGSLGQYSSVISRLIRLDLTDQTLHEEIGKVDASVAWSLNKKLI